MFKKLQEVFLMNRNVMNVSDMRDVNVAGMILSRQRMPLLTARRTTYASFQHWLHRRQTTESVNVSYCCQINQHFISLQSKQILLSCSRHKGTNVSCHGSQLVDQAENIVGSS